MKRRSPLRGKSAKRTSAKRKPAKPRNRKPAPRRVKAVRRRPSPAAAGTARLRRELGEAREQQAATTEVLRVIASSPGALEPVFDSMLENAVRICDATFGIIYRWDSGGLHVAATLNVPPAFANARRAAPPTQDSKTVTGRMLATKALVHIADGRTLETYTEDRDPSVVAAVELGGVRTVLAAPLLRDDELIGSFALFRQVVRPFTDKQIALLESFASQAVIAIENARLLNELRRRTDDLSESLEQQTAAAEVLRVISASLGDLKPVFQAMLENAIRICDAKFGTLFRHENGSFEPVAMFEAPAELAEFHRRRGAFRTTAGTGLDRVRQTKDVVHIADEAAEPTPSVSARLAGARSIVVVPMLKDDELIGVISVYRDEVRPFTDKQIELVRNFAAQAVIAIENARLLSELRQSLEQQTATADVLHVISSSPGELKPVFDSILNNATRICQAEFGSLFLREGEALRVAAHYGSLTKAWDDQWQVGTLLQPDPELQAFQTLSMRRPMQVADLSTAPSYLARNPKAVNSVEVGGIRTMLTVPMLKDGETIGVITIFRTEVREFTDKQIGLVTNFAAQAVIAMENARLLSELRQSLEHQTATADVLGVINASRGDLQPVFEAMVEKARRLCEADSGHLALPVGDDYRSIAVSAMSREMEALIQSVSYAPGRGTAVGRALAERRPVQISDIGADNEHAARQAADKGFIRTILAVPLLRQGEAIGAFGLSRQRVEPFSARQIELVQNFAAQAVIAIENTRLLNELRQRTDDLSKSLEDLRTAQDRLVQTQKLAELGQLTAGIAHEIKNPLNFVNNFSALSVELIDELQETLGRVAADSETRGEITELADTLRGNLDKIAQHGKRADSIVKNMLQHSRASSGDRRPVDVNAVVEESLNLAYHGARAERQGFTVTLERSFDPAAGEAYIFPQEITRVLLNLIANGFYAAAKRQAENAGHEAVLTASTKNLGDKVEIRIRDNGTGMPPEVKEKIFSPFFTTKPAGEGTGLGLSISHDIIVKQHSGAIEVDSEPGQFTEIRIVLPRAPA